MIFNFDCLILDVQGAGSGGLIRFRLNSFGKGVSCRSCRVFASQRHVLTSSPITASKLACLQWCLPQPSIVKYLFPLRFPAYPPVNNLKVSTFLVNLARIQWDSCTAMSGVRAMRLGIQQETLYLV